MSKEKELNKAEQELEQLTQNVVVDTKAQYQKYQNNLQQALYYFTKDNPFIGGLLQEMNFKPEYSLPTAALAYDKNKQTFQILINPDFFDKHSLDHRIGILHHEILHFVNKHHMRFAFDRTDKSKKADAIVSNIATDMSINQYIASLPQGCVDVKHFKTDDGQPFPKFATAEVYAQLIKENPESRKNAKKEAAKEMGVDPDSIEEGENGEGVLDEHFWEGLSEEEKKQMAEEMKKMIKRTMEKTSYSKSSLPDSIKDLIEDIEAYLKKMNYKQILQQAIKKNASFSDRSSTWKRPNKRYGLVAKGSTLGKMPRLNIYIDTSGSISVKEINEFLVILNGFLKAGTRTCQLGFWHTRLYKKKKYKLNGVVKQTDIESGGTDMTEVCADINKHQPDLSIILTDGYYDTRTQPKGEVVVIVSDKGGLKHPLAEKKNVKTISMTGLRGNK